jgi:hypothetical protein
VRVLDKWKEVDGVSLMLISGKRAAFEIGTSTILPVAYSYCCLMYRRMLSFSSSSCLSLFIII